jgi:phage FluMu protein Com
MSYQAVRCTQCHEPILLDSARAIAVGGGAMPYASQSKSTEREIMCPGCRVVTRFSDGDIVTVPEQNEEKPSE